MKKKQIEIRQIGTKKTNRKKRLIGKKRRIGKKRWIGKT